jgi:hypothetical protein
MLNKSGLNYAALALSLAGLLSACSSTKPSTYQLERFDSSASPYAHMFKATSTATCQAARRALLSQGYTADSPKPDTVDGSKYFQPDNDSHVVIAFHVVCTSDYDGAKQSTIYVSATQDRYVLKKTSTSASVGLSILGSISLPIGSSDDSLVKISSETIAAGTFYERYFGLVQHFVDMPQETGPGPAPDNRQLEIQAAHPAGGGTGTTAHEVKDISAAPGVLPTKVATEPEAKISPLPASTAAAPASPAPASAPAPGVSSTASAISSSTLPTSAPASKKAAPAAPAGLAAASAPAAASASAADAPVEAILNGSVDPGAPTAAAPTHTPPAPASASAGMATPASAATVAPAVPASAPAPASAPVPASGG